MTKTSATILRFPMSASEERTLPPNSQSSVRAQMDRRALDLAAVTDELSLRISDGKNKPVTSLQIHKYDRHLAQARALLAQLEESIGHLKPDPI